MNTNDVVKKAAQHYPLLYIRHLCMEEAGELVAACCHTERIDRPESTSDLVQQEVIESAQCMLALMVYREKIGPSYFDGLVSMYADRWNKRMGENPDALRYWQQFWNVQCEIVHSEPNTADDLK